MALGELGRVTAAGGRVAVSAFAAGRTHPAKAAVDDVAVRFGYRTPDWYRDFKELFETRVGTAAGLSRAATAAGLVDIDVIETTAALGALSAQELAAWRLEMPHLRAFVTSLTATDRQRLTARAQAALGEGMPLELPILMVRALPLTDRPCLPRQVGMPAKTGTAAARR